MHANPSSVFRFPGDKCRSWDKPTKWLANVPVTFSASYNLSSWRLVKAAGGARSASQKRPSLTANSNRLGTRPICSKGVQVEVLGGLDIEVLELRHGFQANQSVGRDPRTVQRELAQVNQAA